jgi:hypothetical protein
MNSTEYSLAIVGQLSEKGADGPSGLTVKTYIKVSKILSRTMTAIGKNRLGRLNKFTNQK